MNLKTIRVEPDTSEIQRVLMIVLDDDKERALEFIKEKLAKKDPNCTDVPLSTCL